MTNDNHTFNAALQYADLGYRVLPCAPYSKRPLTVNGLKDATTDVAQIEQWWTASPMANVAIATAGLFVLDLDPQADGSANPWLGDQPEKLLDLACAPMAQTPRGGRHYVFRAPQGKPLRNTASKLAPNVDTRADGGYILVAPSAVDGKPYRWVSEARLDDTARESLPEPPAWLVAMLEAHLSQAGPRVSQGDSSSAIPAGQRNSTLASLAGTMRRVGMGQSAIEAALLADNAVRCRPPLADTEVRTIAASIARHEPDAAAVTLAHGEAKPLYRPIVTRLADVAPEAVRWLWPGRIALGKLTLIAGDPGLGKSFLSLDLAARVSLGSPWPDNRHLSAPLGGVVLLNAEDALGDTVRPRLDAMAAEVSRIIALEAVQGQDRMPINLQRDLPAIEHAIEQVEDCRLVIIDPVSAYLGKVDSHNNADIRAMLHPLADLADRRRVAVVAVTHLNKGQGPAMYRATGSLAFIAAARAAWLVAKDPGSPRRRLLLPVKNNLAGDTLGMAFQIGDGVLQWETDPVAIDADRLLGLSEPGAQREADDAAEHLLHFLANGPVDAADAKEWATANGISDKQLWKAKKALGIVSRKTAFGGRWQWILPVEVHQESQPSKAAILGIFGESSTCPSWDDCLEPTTECTA